MVVTGSFVIYKDGIYNAVLTCNGPSCDVGTSNHRPILSWFTYAAMLAP